jgi:hypothetical protein
MSAAGWLTARAHREKIRIACWPRSKSKGSVVADIGRCGYHVWRLAEIVGPTGKVIGEDIKKT